MRPGACGRIEDPGVAQAGELVVVQGVDFQGESFRAARHEQAAVGQEGVTGAEDVRRRRGHGAHLQRRAIEEARRVDLIGVVMSFVVLVAAEIEDVTGMQERGVNGENLRILR